MEGSRRLYGDWSYGRLDHRTRLALKPFNTGYLVKEATKRE